MRQFRPHVGGRLEQSKSRPRQLGPARITGDFGLGLPEIEVMLTIKNTNLTLAIPDESIAANRR